MTKTITSFRLANTGVQLKIDNTKWVNLIQFKPNCPYGKFGYKMANIKNSFNPYYFFNSIEAKKIEDYLEMQEK